MARVRPIAFFWTGCQYDPSTKILYVMFTLWRKTLTGQKPDGKPYQYKYFNVPVAVGAAFINDDANGEYYNYVIRNHFMYQRIN